LLNLLPPGCPGVDAHHNARAPRHPGTRRHIFHKDRDAVPALARREAAEGRRGPRGHVVEAEEHGHGVATPGEHADMGEHETCAGVSIDRGVYVEVVERRPVAGRGGADGEAANADHHLHRLHKLMGEGEGCGRSGAKEGERERESESEREAESESESEREAERKGAGWDSETG